MSAHRSLERERFHFSRFFFSFSGLLLRPRAWPSPSTAISASKAAAACRTHKKPCPMRMVVSTKGMRGVFQTGIFCKQMQVSAPVP